MNAYRLHYFPESGNSHKLALMLTLCGQEFEPVVRVEAASEIPNAIRQLERRSRAR